VPERDRDQSIEHLLRQVLTRAPAPASAEACLDAETIAAWNAGTLPRTESATIEGHVAGCSRCQALIAILIRTTPEPPAPERIWHRFGLRWLVPLATAATAGALWFAIPSDTPPAVQPVSEERVAMAPPARADEPTAPAARPAAPAASAADLERVQESTAPAPAEAPAAVTLRENRFAADERSRASAERDELAAIDKRADAAKVEALTSARAGARAANERPAAPTRLAASQAVALIESRQPGSSSRWRIVGGRQVEWSTSGTEWDAVALAPADDLTSGSSPSAEVCWLVGRRGLVYVTVNGTEFARVSFPEPVDLSSVTATDARNARVTSADGRSWITSNQGETWLPD
jgi:hypothetical protein